MEMGPYCGKTTALVENHDYFIAQSFVKIFQADLKMNMNMYSSTFHLFN